MQNWIRRRVWLPILEQLRQGTTPEKLAWSIAAGATLSLFPILGATTVLCLIVGAFFRLNPITMQVANYTFGFLQLAAIPIFVRIGESVFGLPRIDFNPVRLAAEFRADMGAFFVAYGRSGLAAIAVWAVFAPPFAMAVRAVTLPFLRRKRVETPCSENPDAKAPPSV